MMSRTPNAIMTIADTMPIQPSIFRFIISSHFSRADRILSIPQVANPKGKINVRNIAAHNGGSVIKAILPPNRIAPMIIKAIPSFIALLLLALVQI